MTISMVVEVGRCVCVVGGGETFLLFTFFDNIGRESGRSPKIGRFMGESLQVCLHCSFAIPTASFQPMTAGKTYQFELFGQLQQLF